MSVLIHRSILESFNFNGVTIRSVHVEDVGQCLVACDVSRAVGYTDDSNGRKAIQRHVPERYQVRFGSVKKEVNQRVHLHPLHADQVLLTEPGLYCFLLRCKMPDAEPFLEWVIETILPREVRKLTEQIAILNDDKEELQGEIRAKDREIDRLHERYVPRRGDYDNVLCFIDKGEPDEEHQYYAIRCQQRALKKHKRMLKSRYPDMVVLDTTDDPNAIHSWYRFRKDIIEDFYKNHFNLTEDTQDMLETIFNVHL